MKLQVINLNGESAGEIELNDSIFAIEPKTESLADVVRWQLAARQAGTHAVKERADISRTAKKLYRQKGTGRARHGARTANIFVGGGIVFGPQVRSHEFKINKKVRKLALKSMLSLKAKENSLIVCDNLDFGSLKTKDLKVCLDKLELSSALFVGEMLEAKNFWSACANLKKVNFLPVIGFNVYDSLRHEKLVLTRSAVSGIEKRLLG